MSKTDWMDDAACRGHPEPNIFFDEDLYDEAKAVCDTCLVSEDCLEYALKERLFDDDYGVYGGLLPRQRRTLRKRLRKKVVDVRRHTA